MKPAVTDEGAAKPGAGVMPQLLATQRRHAREMLLEIVRMRGLMTLLMKRRNGGVWSEAEKAELLRQLRSLSRLSPALLFLLLPGSVLLLPLYAWWLDRRRGRRGTTADRQKLPPDA